jgi:hypothetical protein
MGGPFPKIPQPLLRKDLRCPKCGEGLVAVCHEWPAGLWQLVKFEYFHKARSSGRRRWPCIVWYSRNDAEKRVKLEEEV